MTFKDFDAIILGAIIQVHTDHKNLTYTSSVNDHVLRQLNLIERFGPTYFHIKGKDNIISVCISHLHHQDNNSPLEILSKEATTVNHFSTWSQRRWHTL
jgi:hypothetical protein